MDQTNFELGAYLFTALHVMLVIGGVIVAMMLLNRRLLAHYEGRSHLVFRRQLLQMGAILAALLLTILLLPLPAHMQGQLLSLYGIIVSATIALSSTTLVGNVMAGIMLRMINNFKPGDYITAGEYFGRVSEMDLLHVEIQTEQRDLTTLPNLFLVTHPVRVMRTSGTMLSVELSLGYDVSRHSIERLLLEAANATGLEKPFVQIRALGDFSVTYVISGLLTEVNRLITKRRELRGHTMDLLHKEGIEIVSPTFMNTRAHTPDAQFIPEPQATPANVEPAVSPDAVVFDKADKAESLARMKEKLQELQARLKECEELLVKSTDDIKKAAAQSECENISTQIERLEKLISKREEQISNQ